MKPSIGRIVIFREGGEEAPAIVNVVFEDGTLGMMVFSPSNAQQRDFVTFCEDPLAVGAEGWFWPPKVA